MPRPACAPVPASELEPDAPGSPGPASVIDFWLGQQLRQLRKQHGLSLMTVAKACGISVGLLSQVERGLSSPSVKIVTMLAAQFDVPVESLLRSTGQARLVAAGCVARAGTHRRIDLHDKGIWKEMYTPPAGRSLDLCRARIAPGGSTGDDLFSSSMGEQIGLVLRGTLELWIEDQVLLLQAGDSFSYSSRTPRRWRNPGSDVTEVIWAISRFTHQEICP